MASDSTAIFHRLNIERDVAIPLRDGSHVVADIFRPDAEGGFGTIMTMGPYSKDIHFKDWSADFDYTPPCLKRVLTCTGRPSTRNGGCHKATS
jgi:predicted acyl esterase